MPNTTNRRFFALGAPQQQISGAINSAVLAVIAPSFTGWPTQFPFYAAMELGTASLEIVSVTAIVGTTATIVRAQRGTAAIAHPLGATMDMVAVDQDYDEANAHSSTTAGVHGVAGSVVGTTDVQTLTNKTVTSQLAITTAGTPVITATAAAVNDKLWSGRNSSAVETSNINDVGNATFKGILSAGSAGQFSVSAAGVITASGAATFSGAVSLTAAGTALAVTNNATIGGTLGVTGAVTGLRFNGITHPTTFTTEAVADAAGVVSGDIVFLSAPTGVGYFAGWFKKIGSAYSPLGTITDSNAVQSIIFTPGVALDTPGAGSATWITLGNVTVPVWATKAIVSYTIGGVLATGTGNNVTAALKIGGASGTPARILDPGVVSQRFYHSLNDTVSGLPTGVQSVTILATWVVGGTVYRVDANSKLSAAITFMP